MSIFTFYQHEVKGQDRQWGEGGGMNWRKSCTTVVHILFNTEGQHGLVTLNIAVVLITVSKHTHTDTYSWTYTCSGRDPKTFQSQASFLLCAYRLRLKFSKAEVLHQHVTSNTDFWITPLHWPQHDTGEVERGMKTDRQKKGRRKKYERR